MSRRTIDRVWLLLLALALPAAAGAAVLYRWVTPDGRVEVGTSPPPGVHVELWQPDARPVAPAVPASPATAACERRADAKFGDQQVEQTRARVGELEQKLAQLEDSPVVSQDSTCSSAASSIGGCKSSYFDRDRELESTQLQLDDARARLDDLEDQQRRREPDVDCPRRDEAR